MNTKTKNLVWAFALSGVLLLPACGKNEVKSEKAPTTNLKFETSSVPPAVAMTATAVVSPGQTPGMTNNSIPPMPPGMNSYTRKKSSSGSSTKHSAVNHAVVMAKRSVPMMAAPVPATSSFNSSNSASVPAASFTPVTAQTQKKSGSHWPLIVAGIALLAAVGFYFWTKKAPQHNDFPLPPMGGLSPVSGFTAMSKKVQIETKKQSLWTKKIF